MSRYLSNLILAMQGSGEYHVCIHDAILSGTAMGQMIIQLPEEEADADRVALHYLKSVKVRI